MYSEEILRLIKSKNYYLSNKEYFNVCKTSPQICSVAYNAYNNKYYINTKDGYNFEFNVYKEEEPKVKEKVRYQ